LFEVVNELKEIHRWRRSGEQVQMVRHEAVSIYTGAGISGGFVERIESDIDNIG